MKTKNASALLIIELERSPGAKPLSDQIFDAIYARILSGALRAGDVLPPSRRLSEQLGVARNTVVSAYQRLASEGLVESTTGRGTVVSATLPHEPPKHCPDPKPAQLPARCATPRIPIAAEVSRYAVQEERPFAIMSPDLHSLPGKKWVQTVVRCQKIPWRHNGYSAPEGIPGYRQAVASNLRKTRGLFCSPSQVVATSNIQQGLSISLSLLFQSGDRIAVENPCFPVFRTSIMFQGLECVPIPVDEEGLCVDVLSQLERPVRGVIVSPTHQYPTGSLLSQIRREKLLAWARRTGAWIIEDDCDGELCANGQPSPALAAQDNPLNSVIYLGSFSKSIYPGFKLGYAVVPEELAAAFAGARFLSDRQCCENHEVVLREFINDGNYDSHLRRIRKLYEERRKAFLKHVGRAVGQFGELRASDPGTHAVLYFDKALDDKLLSHFLSRRCGIEARPLSICYAGEPSATGLILGYAGFTETLIAESALKLADGIRRFCSEIPPIEIGSFK